MEAVLASLIALALAQELTGNVRPNPGVSEYNSALTSASGTVRSNTTLPVE